MPYPILIDLLTPLCIITMTKFEGMPKRIKPASNARSTRSSSRAKSEQPLSDVARAQLHVAVDTVPEMRLRQIITSLVDRVPAVAHAVFSKLMVAVKNESGQEPDQNEYVPRWEVCVNCDKEYDAGEEREEGECLYHTGNLEVSYDRLDDYDWNEDFHGPVDTDENRSEYPELFVWSCCKEDGTDEGCEKSMHVPGGMLMKRRKTH
ncbi:hypothetical protein BOTBODRAFT_174852 [Botryobasidium botryosum FD-172 SS1]|uniref:C2H2-type domain-containing protein n=1 Tax=Botryobasidium botryosum (strain FD-172 SS1) TaxID=930990 RepID=A0A067MF43_BOTB1|nr:hypothetical protein BOTBODRAFT_174852 [Botryobasidium botryosum FD-172 SS1]